jgi:hypothetical protein
LMPLPAAHALMAAESLNFAVVFGCARLDVDGSARTLRPLSM